MGEEVSPEEFAEQMRVLVDTHHIMIPLDCPAHARKHAEVRAVKTEASSDTEPVSASASVHAAVAVPASAVRLGVEGATEELGAGAGTETPDTPAAGLSAAATHQRGKGALCEHNRRKSRCKECGGSEICEHQRLKS